MSRISRMKGTRRSAVTITPAQPQKNCGLVAISTSRRRKNSASSVAMIMYDRKLIARRPLPLLAARNVHTRSTRMPSIHSCWSSQLRYPSYTTPVG
jgi:hypothetical protein